MDTRATFRDGISFRRQWRCRGESEWTDAVSFQAKDRARQTNFEWVYPVFAKQVTSFAKLRKTAAFSIEAIHASMWAKDA